MQVPTDAAHTRARKFRSGGRRDNCLSGTSGVGLFRDSGRVSAHDRVSRRAINAGHKFSWLLRFFERNGRRARLGNGPVRVNTSYLWKGRNPEGLPLGRGPGAEAPGMGYPVWQPGSHGEKWPVPSERNEHPS